MSGGHSLYSMVGEGANPIAHWRVLTQKIKTRDEHIMSLTFYYKEL